MGKALFILYKRSGESVSYCRTYLEYNMRSATIPVGYAEGFKRSNSNVYYSVLVIGEEVPTVGRVCMDHDGRR